jgi:hypothetical protein
VFGYQNRFILFNSQVMWTGLTSKHHHATKIVRRFSSQRVLSPPTSQALKRLVSTASDKSDDDETTTTTTASPSTVTESTRNFNPDTLPIKFADISRAEVAIRGGVVRTTCEKSHFISELLGANVYFKNEFRQFTGSFKERGARNAIMQLKREKNSSLRGVIAASAGNHAQALAYHGRELGVPATVVMPTVAPMAKVDKCRVRTTLHSQFIFCLIPLYAFGKLNVIIH